MITFDQLLYTYKWILFVAIVLFAVDVVLVFLATKHDISLQNRYYNWHRKFGIVKFSVLKVAYILWLSYDLLNPPGNAGAAGVSAIIYCYAVITLIGAFVRSFIRKPSVDNSPDK